MTIGNFSNIKNYYTSTLSNILTALILGHDVKYFGLDGARQIYVFDETAEKVIEHYEESDQKISQMTDIKPFMTTNIRTLDQTYDSTNKTHVAKLIAILDSTNKVPSYAYKTQADCSLGFVVGNHILVMADLEVSAGGTDIYQNLKNDQRVDIEWDISLSNAYAEGSI